MFRRTFLKIAAVCIIHPALNWTAPLRMGTISDIQVGSFTFTDTEGVLWKNTELYFECHSRRRQGIITPNV